MRKTRQLVLGFVIATVMSGAILRADAGAPGGPNKGTCGFLQGILYKMPDDVAAKLGPMFEAMWSCDLTF